MVYEGDQDAFLGFIDESNDSLQGIENDFIALESDPGNIEIINRIFRPVHSLKGNSGFFGLTNINKFAHHLENLLDCTRTGEILVNSEIVDVLLRGVEHLQAMLDRVPEDPTDTVLRPDEDEFLAKLEIFQTLETKGSVQSVIKFENLLSEFSDCGLSIKDHAVVSGLLDQIAKTNIEIEKLIAEHERPALESVYSPDCLYFLGEKDFTEKIRFFGTAIEYLEQKKPMDEMLLDSFREAFKELSEYCGDNADLKGKLYDFDYMLIFLSDPLMMSSDELPLTMLTAIDEIVACFEAKPLEGEGSQKIGEILVEQNLVNDEQLTAALKKQKKVGEFLVKDGAVSEKDLQGALEIQGKRTLNAHLKKRKIIEASKTIRIDQSKLDKFADAVGGLYVNLDSMNYVNKQLDEAEVGPDIRTRFNKTIDSFDEQLQALHDGVMGIRRVPVKSLFQRFPKVIRQLSSALGKNIKLIITGEETVIDKDLLEKIENPLVHILRNSVDHGIENPEERAESNKPEQGILGLSASTDENNVYLTISDDGKGIVPATMKKVAIKKGFMTEDEVEQLSDQELINLIFKPGFSAADKVTDVSGRGVGMDVVMSALKECNGSIIVDSALGQGTKVKITIPRTKTLVTKEALIAKAGGENYVIPSDDITTVLESDNIISMLANEKCIAYGDEVFRLVDLAGYFYPQDNFAENNEEFKKIIICREHKVGIVVDKIESYQKIVAKEFGTTYKDMKKVEGVSGFTILGNEEIILIVNVREVAAQSLKN